MGLVLFGRRRKDKNLYALKTLKKWNSVTRDLIPRMASFRREALVWITLVRHRHIVQACWFDLDEAYRPFLIMEYVAGDPELGVSLADRLKKGGPLQPAQAVRFALETLTGLIYARDVVRHDLGLSFVHRDVKPDNLLTTRKGFVKLTDFGLVLAEGVSGTFPYMAPEQWEKDRPPVEEKTDVYALACTIFEMMEGYRLFDGTSKASFRHQHFNKKPQFGGKIPADINSVLMRCLAKPFDQRPGFLELREELQRIHMRITNRPIQLTDEPEPLFAEDLNARGSGFDELGHYDKAIDCYNQAIELDPKEPRFFLNRANARRIIEDLEGAVQDFEKAQELESYPVNALLGKAAVLVQCLEPEQALACYEQCKQIAPFDPFIYVSSGNLYAQKKQYERAMSEFLTALKLRPMLAEAHLGLGNIYLCNMQYREAEKSYRTATRIHPLYEPAYLNLARLYQLMKKPEERDQAMEMAGLIMNHLE
jgi:serine/threonine protein kinase